MASVERTEPATHLTAEREERPSMGADRPNIERAFREAPAMMSTAHIEWMLDDEVVSNGRLLVFEHGETPQEAIEAAKDRIEEALADGGGSMRGWRQILGREVEDSDRVVVYQLRPFRLFVNVTVPPPLDEPDAEPALVARYAALWEGSLLVVPGGS